VLCELGQGGHCPGRQGDLAVRKASTLQFVTERVGVQHLRRSLPCFVDRFVAEDGWLFYLMLCCTPLLYPGGQIPMPPTRNPLEAHTRSQIDIRLHPRRMTILRSDERFQVRSANRAVRLYL